MVPLVPLTVHTPVPLEGPTEKTTGLPEAPPVAFRVADPPGVPLLGAVKEMAWGLRPTAMAWETCGAAA